jgi:hypothetical protein
MHDPAQNPTIIMALGTTLVGRQVGMNFRPLLIAEPKQNCAHQLGPPNRLTKPLNPNTIN